MFLNRKKTTLRKVTVRVKKPLKPCPNQFSSTLTPASLEKSTSGSNHPEEKSQSSIVNSSRLTSYTISPDSETGNSQFSEAQASEKSELHSAHKIYQDHEPYTRKRKLSETIHQDSQRLVKSKDFNQNTRDITKPTSSNIKRRWRCRETTRKNAHDNERLTDDGEDFDDDDNKNGILTELPRLISDSLKILLPDSRQFYALETWNDDDIKAYRLIHSEHLTSKDEKDYVKAFDDDGIVEDERLIFELRYPSHAPPERFRLVLPRDPSSYNPIVDITDSVDQIVTNYLAIENDEEFQGEVEKVSRLFKQAIARKSYKIFREAGARYNWVISRGIEDGGVSRVMKENRTLTFPLIERILCQVYSRTVSPSVELLRKYENGTSDVYGELLPRFIWRILRESEVKEDSVFVDMGSGVGNVVLQAALQIGCEAWGIEKNKNPCLLAERQLEEFKARCRLWGVRPGKVRLLEGDFLESREIDAVLSRADVVLVNNQAFRPELNDKLTMKFLDLKEGTRIVSLKSFVPEYGFLKHRNIEDPRCMLRVKRHVYFSDCVSWTDQGGEYFISTKDTSMLRDFVDRRRINERSS